MTYTQCFGRRFRKLDFSFFDFFYNREYYFTSVTNFFPTLIILKNDAWQMSVEVEFLKDGVQENYMKFLQLFCCEPNERYSIRNFGNIDRFVS